MNLQLVTRVVALTAGGVLALTACGAGGGTNLPTLEPSRIQSAVPSVTSPTLTLPTLTPSRTVGSSTTEPTATEPTTTSSEPEPTSSEPLPTSIEPSPTSTEQATPTTAATTSTSTSTEPSTTTTAPTTATAAGTTSVGAEAAAEQTSGVPAWVWWVLALVVVALAITLLVRRRRREQWLTDLASARAEVEWFARSLIPDLRATGARERAAGGWTVSAGRILSTEDRLTALGGSAPDETARERAMILRDAVRGARERLDALGTFGTDDTLPTDLDAIAGELEAALATTSPETTSGPTGPSGPTDSTGPTGPET